MPWRCPACRLAIRHNETETQPRRGVIYRCHICRLELVVDEFTGKMTVAPIDVSDARPINGPDGSGSN